MTASLAASEKSTNVRPVSMALFAALVKAVGRVRPPAASELMLKAFCTPRRGSTAAWPRGLAPERGQLQLEGEQIALYQWGPSLNGKKVLLAHGWSGRSEQLRALVEPLRERGYGVVAFDQTAHGNSSGKTTNLPRFARTLKAVVEHLGPIDTVVAHSLGASAAAYAVGEGLPIERLVLIAPPSHPRRFIVGFWRMLGIKDELGEQMNRLIERREGVRLRDLELPRVAAKVRKPLLVIHDRRDREVPFAEGEQWSREVPQARLLVTEGLGHNRVLAAPAVTAAIAQFVAG